MRHDHRPRPRLHGVMAVLSSLRIKRWAVDNGLVTGFLFLIVAFFFFLNFWSWLVLRPVIFFLKVRLTNLLTNRL